MQGPQHTPLEVRQPAVRIHQLGARRERHRHRVDREVTPREVGTEIGAADDRKGARARVGLRPSRREVDLDALHLHGRGVKSRVGAQLATEAARQLELDRPRPRCRGRPGRGRAAGRGRRLRPGRREAPPTAARTRSMPASASSRSASRCGSIFRCWAVIWSALKEPSGAFPTMTALADGSRTEDLAFVERPAPTRGGRWSGPDRGGRGGPRRLPGPEAPRRRLAPRTPRSPRRRRP